MFNMGIGGSDHDISVCISDGERIAVAIDEERVTRFKYGIGSDYLKGHSRKYCLEALNLDMSDIKNIIGTDILVPSAYFGIRNRVKLINHHMAHAASTFYPSPFEDAAILIVDNGGSFVNSNGVEGIETITYAVGRGNKIEVISKVVGMNWNQIKGDSDNSLGHFYKMISKAAGFVYFENTSGIYEGLYFTEDGKTMGLASYGTDKYVDKVSKFFEFLPQGQIRINLNDGQLETLFNSILESDSDSFQVKADISYAGQKLLEKSILHCTNYLYEATGLTNLCIAGGVGLNSVANGMIIKNTGFKDIFIQPAAGDNGTAIGCALYGHYVIEGNPRTEAATMNNAYFGKEYKEADIISAINSLDKENYIVSKSENIAKTAAEYISQQKIVGWFQGKSEYGPRALGHRSILVDPRNPEMKDILNHRVKKRESFRPFAPAIPVELASEYFDINISAPYMLLVCDVLEHKKSEIPSVTHVDGTARLQTVSGENNDLYYKLIKYFHEITGTPVVLNTSFNIKGEPIVETPQDAVNCFANTDIDCLAMGDYFIIKKK